MGSPVQHILYVFPYVYCLFSYICLYFMHVKESCLHVLLWLNPSCAATQVTRYSYQKEPHTVRS